MTCDTEVAFDDDEGEGLLFVTHHHLCYLLLQSASLSSKKCSIHEMFTIIRPSLRSWCTIKSELSRWRKRRELDDTGSSIGSTIVYSIEQVENAVQVIFEDTKHSQSNAVQDIF